MKKSDKERIERAKKHLDRIRELVAQRPSPFEGMTKDEVIEQLRKTRKELWQEKMRDKKIVTRT
ncbi:MAG: hypothetical protein AB1633_07390 [Elusimicrobiota bacterium]